MKKCRHFKNKINIFFHKTKLFTTNTSKTAYIFWTLIRRHWDQNYKSKVRIFICKIVVDKCHFNFEKVFNNEVLHFKILLKWWVRVWEVRMLSVGLDVMQKNKIYVCVRVKDFFPNFSFNTKQNKALNWYFNQNCLS